MAGLASPLIVTLDRALDRDRPSRISIQGHGSISVYPREGSCTADIHDWHSLPLTDASGIQTSASIWSTAPSGSLPVPMLRWLAAYHHACQLLEAGPPSRGLVRLLRWPDLADVPDELAPAVVRICALLWRKPCASTLMSHVLGAAPVPTAALLRVLQDQGCVDISTGFSDRMEPDGHAAANDAPNDAAPASAPARVIARLWHRLRGS